MSFGDEIRRIREARGWTQRQLAEKMGIFQSVVSRLENGKNTTTRALERVALVLNRELRITFYEQQVQGPKTPKVGAENRESGASNGLCMASSAAFFVSKDVAEKGTRQPK
jgi:transcriptional regulator with XRE-family HTH domain